MSIAVSVQDCLAREGVHYEMIAHERTRDSNHTAQAAHIPGDQLAKCVMLADDKGYLMAVITASHMVDLGAVHRKVNRALGLATDRGLVDLFKDREPGALPPVGPPYRLATDFYQRLDGAPNNY